MSRMILALCVLTIASGCCIDPNAPRRVSLVAARLETLGPSGPHRACKDCIPHRPWTNGYVDWWDFHITEHTAQKCAFRDFAAYRRQCGRPTSHHFKCGFISAYEDLALNRRPSPPVMPPPKYWNAFYRSPAGQPYVDDWFAGYDAGLAMGANAGVSQFHEVYLRRGGCNLNGGYNGWDTGSTSRYDDGAVATNNMGYQQPLSPTPKHTPSPTMPLRVIAPANQ